MADAATREYHRHAHIVGTPPHLAGKPMVDLVDQHHDQSRIDGDAPVAFALPPSIPVMDDFIPLLEQVITIRGDTITANDQGTHFARTPFAQVVPDTAVIIDSHTHVDNDLIGISTCRPRQFA
jgi:hypothetical protein